MRDTDNHVFTSYSANSQMNRWYVCYEYISNERDVTYSILMDEEPIKRREEDGALSLDESGFPQVNPRLLSDKYSDPFSFGAFFPYFHARASLVRLSQ